MVTARYLKSAILKKNSARVRILLAHLEKTTGTLEMHLYLYRTDRLVCLTFEFTLPSPLLSSQSLDSSSLLYENPPSPFSYLTSHSPSIFSLSKELPTAGSMSIRIIFFSTSLKMNLPNPDPPCLYLQNLPLPDVDSSDLLSVAPAEYQQGHTVIIFEQLVVHKHYKYILQIIIDIC